jgi:two-component system chemotaxis sensor kinase CheA
MDQFKLSFREEAREIVAELEATLLELDGDTAESENVSKTFRGLHTIKGSGAMFGFDQLAAFTHEIENAFDAVRNGGLAISPELIDLTLQAVDQIKLMVEEEPGSGACDAARCGEILRGVRALMGPPSSSPSTSPSSSLSSSLSSTPSPSPAQPARESAPLASGSASSPCAQWRIRFAPGPELLRDGTNPLLLLNELAHLGSLQVAADLSAIPPLAELDPERCYISWSLTLSTRSPLESIRDVFIFVEDSCELTIEPVPPEDAHLAQPCDGDLAAQQLEEPRATSGGRRSYDRPDIATSIRVPAAKLDQFVDLVGELVTVQARLGAIAMQRNDLEVVAVAEEIERLTAALRETSMNIRMLPIRSTFEKFRRLVHDLARDLHKEVELTIEGADTELDKTVIDQLSDPLMHLIRNSMDHGIEPPAGRIAASKRPTARIHLSARHSGANVLVSVSDDGRGIDADAVLRRAIERGLIPAGAQLKESEVFALIFEPGFSTAQQVTDVSGRGVGMDVVRQRVDALRGSIEIDSKPGQGTRVTLRLPLTMAIIDGLLVSVDNAYFVLPLANTLECIELTQQDIDRAHGKHVANVRGDIVPYIRLRQHFNIRTARPEREQIMIVETEDGRFGFVVDRVLGDYQTVIKNLGKLYRHVQIVSGATILGDGNIALILDPNRLVQEAFRGSAPTPAMPASPFLASTLPVSPLLARPSPRTHAAAIAAASP